MKLLHLLLVGIFFNLNSCLAQHSELNVFYIGANSINTVPTKLSTEFGIRHFWAPVSEYGLTYRKQVNNNKHLFYYTAIAILETSTNIRWKYKPNEQDCPACNAVSEQTFWSQDLGLKLGFGNSFDLRKKRKLDFTLGFMLRILNDNATGGNSGTRCNTEVCFKAFSDYRPSINSKLHPNLFTLISYTIFQDKKDRFRLRINAIYNQGLHGIYKSIGKLDRLDGPESFNFIYTNRGSYFGVGISVGWIKGIKLGKISL